MTLLQCDVCHFINIMGREPLELSATDARLLKCIHRVNLDVFWAREPSTVGGVLLKVKISLAIVTQLGYTNSLFHPRGPFPVVDLTGMGIAVVMVQRSLNKGHYADTLQFETVRKFHSAASNIFHSSVEGQGAMVMAKDTRKLQVTTCPTYSDFFECFWKGLHKCMGDIVHPDRAITHNILKEIMNVLDQEWETIQLDQHLNLALEGAYYALGFTLALHGEELPLVELHSITKFWTQTVQHKKPHIVTTLLGHFKNEVWESYHLMPVLFMTPRGLEPGK
jgi:hypothetical protein